jgi:hypothetical protein
VRDFEKVLERGLVERGDDQKDRIGPGDDGFEDLSLVNDEIFAQAGDVELLADEAEVFEAALEVFFVGEDGDGVRAGFFIATGDGERVEISGDGACGGRGALHLGDHGEAGGIGAQGVVKGAHVIAHGGGGTELFGTREQLLELEVLLRDDFVQFVHEGRG